MPTPKHLSSLRELERELKKDRKRIDRGLRKAAQKTAKQGKRLVKKRAPREIRAGIIDERTQTGAMIRSTHPGSLSVEHGRRPGTMPPIGPILEWVKRTATLRKSSASARAIARLGNETSTPIDAPEHVAFAIAKSIEKKGTDPRPFMEPSVPEVQALLETHVLAFLSGEK